MRDTNVSTYCPKDKQLVIQMKHKFKTYTRRASRVLNSYFFYKTGGLRVKGVGKE